MRERFCRVLVIDDEPVMREVLEARLSQWGYPVAVAASAAEASTKLDEFEPHVVISDLVLPDATGLALLKQIRRGNAERTVYLITAYGTIDVAVQAIKEGAAEFLTKPLDYVDLRKKIDSVEAQLRSKPDQQLAGRTAFHHMVGESSALRAMQRELQFAASSDNPVLIVGESGSGKELVARTLAGLSSRKSGPFVPVNTSAVPEALAEAEFFGVEKGAFTGADVSRGGYFDHASGGILFLDEVTEMPLSLQPKFLRVLEDGQVRRVGARDLAGCDVRVIAATNRDPEKEVAAGRFRADLFYRLNVFRITVPPLRQRKSDIPALVSAFAQEVARGRGCPDFEFEPAVFDKLMRYDFPGNIRELKNWVARATARAGGAAVSALHVDLDSDAQVAEATAQPTEFGSGAGENKRVIGFQGIVLPPGTTAAEAERILIMETLRSTGNNKAEAARRLGVDVKTIRNKLKSFDPDDSMR